MLKVAMELLQALVIKVEQVALEVATGISEAALMVATEVVQVELDRVLQLVILASLQEH